MSADTRRDTAGTGPAAEPVALAEIDDTIHARVRLGAMAILAVEGPRDFVALRKALGVSDGNLATHLRVLEEAGYVEARKAFAGRKPRTTYSATGRGRRALAAYAAAMERLLRGVTPDGC